MGLSARQFSALILMPPPHLRTFLRKTGKPSLSGVLSVHEQYVVSKEAAARAYVEYHDETIAIAIVRDGSIQRIYRERSFPRLGIARGDALPRSAQVQGGIGTISEMREADAAHWLESDFGVALPALYQQTLAQANGFAMVLLWPEARDDDETDPDEDRTSKQRYADRMSKRQ